MPEFLSGPIAEMLTDLVMLPVRALILKFLWDAYAPIRWKAVFFGNGTNILASMPYRAAVAIVFIAWASFGR